MNTRRSIRPYKSCQLNDIFDRTLKFHRLIDFNEKTESRTSFPNLFRIIKMMTSIFILFHWNACIYFSISKSYGIDGKLFFVR